jgi:hypothetical protein
MPTSICSTTMIVMVSTMASTCCSTQTRSIRQPRSMPSST